MGEKKFICMQQFKKDIAKIEKHGKKARDLKSTIEFILEKILMGRLIKQINFLQI